MRLFKIILLSILIISCSKEDEPILNNDKDILSFKIIDGNKTYTGQIESDNTINIDIQNLDISQSISPQIQYSGASITPSINSKQNFSNSIIYTITAENGTTKTYTVKASSSLNKISSFKIIVNNEEILGKINEQAREILLKTKGLEKETSIVPTITFPTNASISPSLSLAQNFNQNISYTVTAFNGEQREYTIITDNTEFSTEKKILEFNLKVGNNEYVGDIDHENFTIDIIANDDVSNIKPTIKISDKATITPNEDDFQDFTNTSNIEYKVTAEDGSENIYKVNTKVYTFFNNNSNRKYFKNSQATITGIGIDLTTPNSKLVIENSLNSYEISPIKTINNSGKQIYYIYDFPNNIETGTDYKLKYKIGNTVLVESSFLLDILSENLPLITSTSKKVYKRRDTLIINGENLYQGLYIYAVNGSIYSYGNNNISLNSSKTELSLFLDNDQMFPSYYGNSQNFSTKIQILKDGRFGPSVYVEFD